VLDEFKVKIVARDAARQEHVDTAIHTVEVTSPELTQTATETSSKKVEKKCCLREKRAAAKQLTSQIATAKSSVTVESSALTPAPIPPAIPTPAPTHTTSVDPKDYTLDEVDEVIRRIQKRSEKEGVPFPDERQAHFEAMKLAIAA
jgi:hypothetical protein